MDRNEGRHAETVVGVLVLRGVDPVLARESVGIAFELGAEWTAENITRDCASWARFLAALDALSAQTPIGAVDASTLAGIAWTVEDGMRFLRRCARCAAAPAQVH